MKWPESSSPVGSFHDHPVARLICHLVIQRIARVNLDVVKPCLLCDENMGLGWDHLQRRHGLEWRERLAVILAAWRDELAAAGVDLSEAEVALDEVMLE